ncbi:MORN repeat-containing protein [Pedobacter sp. ok626]|uniref:MORN repeat-containing protein n=1 Tax=Pedobacter sp. ok626 TaxID=1761882 RepID=UPI0008833FEC|nr:hypothetical protein [Pedobacter sp. ok626]SDL15385.1 MORN repeat-containing protein [Pedobacter sp. ok626]
MKKNLLTILILLFTFRVGAQCINGDCNNGTGTYKASNYVYEGQFKNGMPQGKGRLVKVTGDMYTGNFVNGLYSGYGTLFYDNGDVYNGQFREGMYHGEGTFKKTDGTTQSGIFLNNSLNGNIEAMNFYSATGLSMKLGQFDMANNRVNLLYPEAIQATFNLNTGNRIIDSIYDKKNTYKPSLGFLNNKKYKDFRLLKNGDNYSLIASPVKGKAKNRSYEVYKITPDEKTEKLMRINSEYFSTSNFIFSADNKLLFEGGHIYAADNSNGVSCEEWGSNFVFFSANNDTLYRLNHDIMVDDNLHAYSYSKPIQEDKGIEVTKFDTKTGKLISRKTYFINRLKGIDHGYCLAGFDDKTGKALVYFDFFTESYSPKNGSVYSQFDYAYRKAAIVDINDPDYMLPLKDPSITKMYFAKQSGDMAAELQAERIELERIRNERNGKTSLIDNEEEYYQPTNTRKKKTTSLNWNDIENIIKSNSSPTQSGESAWDKLFREREKQSNKDYKKKNDGYRGY